ncbi:MAG: hypothetical protein OXC03_02705 [Flavobacteriaceae bacterium]|nr:hypothetical protein [Flavobacteriaceae bacterium]
MNTLFLYRHYILIFTSTLALLFLISCSTDDPEPINEEEEITHIVLNVTTAGSASQDLTWTEDGITPDQPIRLSTTTPSDVKLSFRNLSDPSDPEEVNPEIIEEIDEHQVFIEFAGVNVQTSSDSSDPKDSNGKGVNLNTKWTSSGAGSGTVKIYLVHEPTNKNASSRSGAGGSTDVEVEFRVEIQ